MNNNYSIETLKAMNLDRVQLVQDNYMQHLPMDIVAFTFSEVGAMGTPGRMEFITSDGADYYADYCDDLTDDEIKIIYPIFCDCTIIPRELRNIPAPGWRGLYLSPGNHMFVKDTIWEEFSQGMEAVRLQDPWGENVVDDYGNIPMHLYLSPYRVALAKQVAFNLISKKLKK